MGNYAIFQMLENPRRGRQARNFTTNVPKILDLKSSSEQMFSRKLTLGAPVTFTLLLCRYIYNGTNFRAFTEINFCNVVLGNKSEIVFIGD